MKKIACYVGATSLIFVYLYILLISLNTNNASEEYQRYYIRKEVKSYVSDDELNTYLPNEEFYYGQDGRNKNLGIGWGVIEPNGTWYEGNYSDFFINILNPRKEYELEINCHLEMGYQNTLYLNGEEQGPIQFIDNKAVVPIQSGLIEGINKFSISTTDQVVSYCEIHPETTDTRKSNIYVKSIILKEK